MITASIMKGLSTVPETGLSVFHLLTVKEFKMGFTKSKPRIIT